MHFSLISQFSYSFFHGLSSLPHLVLLIFFYYFICRLDREHIVRRINILELYIVHPARIHIHICFFLFFFPFRIHDTQNICSEELEFPLIFITIRFVRFFTLHSCQSNSNAINISDSSAEMSCILLLFFIIGICTIHVY